VYLVVVGGKTESAVPIDDLSDIVDIENKKKSPSISLS